MSAGFHQTDIRDACRNFLLPGHQSVDIKRIACEAFAGCNVQILQKWDFPNTDNALKGLAPSPDETGFQKPENQNSLYGVLCKQFVKKHWRGIVVGLINRI